jgi:hypothetical protein
MARPIKHRGKWRIRWIDAAGRRRSEVYETHDDAAFALKRHEVAVDEVRRGFRKLRPDDRTVNEICDYWLANRAPRKKRLPPSQRPPLISDARYHLRKVSELPVSGQRWERPLQWNGVAHSHGHYLVRGDYHEVLS